MTVEEDIGFEEINKKYQERREREVCEHLAMCERVRKKLELPVDALGLIDQLLRGEGRYSLPFASNRPVEPVTTRAPMRILSEKPIKKTDPVTGKPTPVIARPQTAAMRVEEIEILGNPDHWMIADIHVGTRSQFPQSGPPVPGRLFTPGGTCHHFITEAIQTAMDFTMYVHYVGPNSDGEIFEAIAMGKMATY